MDNRFYDSLTKKLEKINFEDTHYEFNEIAIPIPNMLIDDSDPLVDIVEDEKARKEAKSFIKLAGVINRKEETGISVSLENTTEKTSKGNITIINVIFKVNKSFDFEEFKDIMGNTK